MNVGYKVVTKTAYIFYINGKVSVCFDRGIRKKGTKKRRSRGKVRNRKEKKEFFRKRKQMILMLYAVKKAIKREKKMNIRVGMEILKKKDKDKKKR